MAIEVSQITQDQFTAIFSRQEGHFIDFKAIEIAPSKLTNTISAFSNANGGELFIGVDETKVSKTKAIHSWRGFAIQEAAKGHIQVFEELFPLGQYYSYAFLEYANAAGLVLHVEVRKSKDIILASNGVAYLRRGPQNLPQDTPAKMSRLRLDKGLISFETETVAVDVSIVSNSVPMLENPPRIHPCRPIFLRHEEESQNAHAQLGRNLTG